MKRFLKRTLTLGSVLLLSLCTSVALHAAPPVYTGGLDFISLDEDSGTIG